MRMIKKINFEINFEVPFSYNPNISIIYPAFNHYYVSYVLGLITTTGRTLDREKQEEHILEVSVLICFKIYFDCVCPLICVLHSFVSSLVGSSVGLSVCLSVYLQLYRFLPNIKD